VKLLVTCAAADGGVVGVDVGMKEDEAGRATTGVDAVLNSVLLSFRLVLESQS
jgi:hypothetical protein